MPIEGAEGQTAAEAGENDRALRGAENPEMRSEIERSGGGKSTASGYTGRASHCPPLSSTIQSGAYVMNAKRAISRCLTYPEAVKIRRLLDAASYVSTES